MSAKVRVRWLMLILGVALGLRVGLGLVHPFWFPDSLDYEGLARGMLEGRGYSVGGLVASRMPGYSFFLAGVYGVGFGVQGVMVLQGVMGVVCVWLVYLIGRRDAAAAAMPTRASAPLVGVLAAGLVAVDPLSVGFSAAVLSEAGFTLMLMVGLWVGMRLMEGGRFWWWVVLGVVWGVGVYLRGSVIWCLVPLGVVIGWGRSSAGWRCHVLGVLVAVGVMLVVLMPWQVRNYLRFGEGYFRLTTLEGISLYEAVYPGADGGPRQDFIEVPEEMRGLDEARRNDEWMRRGRGYLVGEPGRMAGLGVRKVGRTWSPFMNAGEFRRPVVQWGMGLWHIPLFIFGVIGVFAPVLPLRIRGLLLVPVVYLTVVHAVFLGSVRYRVPLMPIVCLFSAAGIVAVMKWMRGKRDAELEV